MEAFLGFREIIRVSLILLIIYVYLQIHPISAQLHLYDCTNTIGNYTQNSTFHSNLNSILTSLSLDINTIYGFYSNKAGNGVDQVHALAYCRGDVFDIVTCQDCLNDAAGNLTSNFCPNQKEAIVWRDYCMFRYSNNSILGIMSLTPSITLVNINNASNVNLYSWQLNSLADNLTTAVYRSLRKFKEIKRSDPNAATVYGLMECTPGLTPDDCKACLTSIANELSTCCYTHVGAQLLTPSCIYRFEIYNQFIEDDSIQLPPPPPPSLSPPPSPLLPPPTPPSSPLLPPPPTAEGKRIKSKAVIIVVCVIIASLVLTVSFYVLITRRRRQKAITEHQQEEVGEDDAFEGITQYNFAFIRAITNGFSKANMLGKGGFGEVYKGVLSDGKEIAVKRLSTTSVQGENEFRNEVKLLAKLQHNCLVRLLGFSLEQTERLLVYEFMPNGSLDKVLFGDAVNRSRLDWKHRYRIINNIAKGLLYLHEDSRLLIIHRDLKAGNILLDENMNAKISDFGTARLFILEDNEANTRRIVGTLGYMAPEYAMHGLFSVKSDVYSYGVLLLEVVSGKRNYYSLTEDSSEGLLSYAYKAWKQGKASDLIDPMLMASSDSLEHMIRCINIALLCVQDNVGSRPTMASVNLMLQSLTIALPIPFEPGFFNSCTRSWLSEFLESANQNDPPPYEETDSYSYPR